MIKYVECDNVFMTEIAEMDRGEETHAEEVCLKVSENSTTLLITRTALAIALLVMVQVITRSMGQLVTGSCVNFVLACTVLLLGLKSASFVSVISPAMAFLLGIGTPLLPMVPVIMLGNFVYVLIISMLYKIFNGPVKGLLTIGGAALLKFAFLLAMVTKVVLPFLGLPEAKAAAITMSFSWPQLVTALIGGVLALELYPRLQKVIE